MPEKLYVATRKGLFAVVRNGAWKIAKRHVVIHYFNPIPGAQMSSPAG